MNYDEAIKALQKIESFHAYDGQFDNELKVIFSFIETAKKEHELLGLKNEMINAYQAYLASLHTIDISMIDKWKNEIFRLQNVIYTKEKELERELK